MSLYKELNEVKIDLNEFEEIPLTKLEEKRLKKVLLQKQSMKRKFRWFPAVAALLIGTSAVFLINNQTIANMPFVAGLIEQYNTSNKEADYSNYKTVIGESTENELGRLTLNEVVVDFQKILISATFEPADGVHFSYQTHLLPTVLVNGEKLPDVRTGSQSIELNDGMYTIYNDIDLGREFEGENLDIKLQYDRMLDYRFGQHTDEAIDHPWTYDVTVSQANMQLEKVDMPINQFVQLTTGKSLTVTRIVTTPISTTLYFEGLENDQSPDFVFYDAKGAAYTFSEKHTEDDGSGMVLYNGVSFVNKKFQLEIQENGKAISDTYSFEAILEK